MTSKDQGGNKQNSQSHALIIRVPFVLDQMELIQNQEQPYEIGDDMEMVACVRSRLCSDIDVPEASVSKQHRRHDEPLLQEILPNL